MSLLLWVAVIAAVLCAIDAVVVLSLLVLTRPRSRSVAARRGEVRVRVMSPARGRPRTIRLHH